LLATHEAAANAIAHGQPESPVNMMNELMSEVAIQTKTSVRMLTG
jgi:hypothetical protein